MGIKTKICVEFFLHLGAKICEENKSYKFILSYIYVYIFILLIY